MKKFVFFPAICFALSIFDADASSLKGAVSVDGSSTVFLISEAVGEEFQKQERNVKVTIAVSGTGGGFKKFCKGELDLTGASRPIDSAEVQACESHSVEFVELPVAYDGIAIVVHPSNTWADSLTPEELKKIWEPSENSQAHPVKYWSDIRSNWPKEAFRLYGPGHDSGTFDYFTKAINGKEKASRSDFTASEDDHVLASGVAGDKSALGYFGFAYYVASKEKLKVVPVDAGTGSVVPSNQTISSGIYTPLSRPVFIYVSKRSLERPEVMAFSEYYIANAGKLAEEVGYISLGENLYNLVKERLKNKVTGSMYGKERTLTNISLSEALKATAKK